MKALGIAFIKRERLYLLLLLLKEGDIVIFIDFLNINFLIYLKYFCLLTSYISLFLKVL